MKFRLTDKKSGSVKQLLYNKQGVALPIIIMIIAIVFLFCAALLTLNENQTSNVRFFSAYEDALHIAEAGYNKYLYFLNDDPTFYKKPGGAPGDGFVVQETYSAADNPLWAGFPKTYEEIELKNGPVLLGICKIHVIPPTPLKPDLTIISTGASAKSPDIKRTIQVKIYKRTFTSFVAFFGNMEVPWGGSSHIRGPFFTNGNLKTRDRPTFYDEVGYAGNKEYEAGSNPIFLMDNQPQKKGALAFPASSTELEQRASDGYKFRGRTCILINNDKLKISNKERSGVPETVIENYPLPSNGVIYVDGDVFVSGKLDGRLTIGSGANIYITTKDPTNFNPRNAQPTYGLKYQNDNIPMERKIPSGTMSDDILGLISDDDIIIATTTWPSSSGSGISTDNSPDDVVAYQTSGGEKGIYLYAALLSGNSYYAEDIPSCGDYGSLYLRGSVSTPRSAGTYAMESRYPYNIYGFRGDYNFDYRMLYESPPNFLEPKNSGWEVRSWEEINPD